MTTSFPQSPTPQRQTSFIEMLRRRWQASGSLVCVGLDPELERIPQAARSGQSGAASAETGAADGEIEQTLVAFTQAIVDATAEVVCAYKPNSAFYEQYGPGGVRALQRLITYIHSRYPEIPVLLDAKRGDIGSTSAAYARAAFDTMQADAVTLHPYLGREALDPFLQRADRGCFILCRTSNPGAGEFQDLALRGADGDERPLYQRVAHAVASEWNTHSNCALVVGATYPEELRTVRAIVGDMPILVPGIGAQGGDLAGVVRNGLDASGNGLIISLSRSVLYASSSDDFAESGRREAERVMRAINDLRK
ncbi:MAG TPA: orotidine-5'-phosphate decarboxylase [Ktedonobacterales bacterium]|nr:orotidine-5'-phosphate decarboxylase [Ktedonobacterales bacterium]